MRVPPASLYLSTPFFSCSRVKKLKYLVRPCLSDMILDYHLMQAKTHMRIVLSSDQYYSTMLVTSNGKRKREGGELTSAVDGSTLGPNL